MEAQAELFKSALMRVDVAFRNLDSSEISITESCNFVWSMHTKAPILVATRDIFDLLRGVMTHSLHDVDVNVRRSTAAVLHETAELVFDWVQVLLQEMLLIL